MIIVKIIIVSTLLLSVNAQCRQSSDSVIGDLCYSFPTTQLNFTDARNYCHSRNQNLAVIHDKNQNQFLATLVRTRSSSSISSFWMGLSRSSFNSLYIWDDGTPLGWSNFGNGPQGGLYVAESTKDGKWETLHGQIAMNFVCSYSLYSEPSSTVTPLWTTTIKPIPSVTCLFLVDLQSSGISQAAIKTYRTYFNFAKVVGSKLNASSDFHGYFDSFGYFDGLADHSVYYPDNYTGFANTPFPVGGTNSAIDLDLKDVDATLTTATWNPRAKSATCMVFFSAAPEAMYGGTSIKPTYESFTTVVGVLLGGVSFIPGLTNVISAPTLSETDASAVVQRLLESLP